MEAITAIDIPFSGGSVIFLDADQSFCIGAIEAENRETLSYWETGTTYYLIIQIKR